MGMENLLHTNDTSPEHGILALVDIVNFTQQTSRLGDLNASFFVKHFQSEACKIIETQGFTVLKDLGDAILFWGNETAKFVGIIKDFCQPAYCRQLWI